MEDIAVKTNSLRAWMLAARPKTLTGASVPVMTALALAWADMGADGFMWLPAVLCVAFAFVMQIDANFVNDYFDYMRGNDDDTRLGPARACAMGWITPASMRLGIAITTAMACIIGLPLIMYGGVEMVIVGAACVLFCFLYTTCLASVAMGDVLVLVFFGIVPVCTTYYIQTQTVTALAVIASVACGLVIDTLLVVNNYRDIDNDRRAGKKTLIVAIGAKWGLRLYWALGFAAFLAGAYYAACDHLWTGILPAGYLMLHSVTYKKMKVIRAGKQLNTVLADTARNMFVYGLLVAIGLLIG